MERAAAVRLRVKIRNPVVGKYLGKVRIEPSLLNDSAGTRENDPQGLSEVATERELPYWPTRRSKVDRGEFEPLLCRSKELKIMAPGRRPLLPLPEN